MTTKLQRCMNYLKSGRSISPAEAVVNGFGFRLADLIYRMRHEHGMNVVTEIRENPSTGEKYARYRLPQKGNKARLTCWCHYGEVVTLTGKNPEPGFYGFRDKQGWRGLTHQNKFEVITDAA